MIKRIAIIGPESTGKTTLAEQLANQYKTVWVPEYAREYIAKLKQKYTSEDIEIISKEQLRKEDEKVVQANQLLFCDTNMIVSKIWIEDAFGKCPDWIIEEIKNRKYDFYLLANIDLPWFADPQREHPHRREYFFKLYEEELNREKSTYEIISGKNEERLNNAIKALRKHSLVP